MPHSSTPHGPAIVAEDLRHTFGTVVALAGLLLVFVLLAVRAFRRA